MDAFLFPNTPVNNHRRDREYDSTPRLHTSSQYASEYDLRPSRPNNVKNPSWNEIIRNATHESLMGSGNIAYIKLADELRVSQANLEAQMIIANTFQTMLTAHTNTSNEGNLHILDTEPCLPREKCGVKFFTSREWTHYVEQQGNIGLAVKKTDFLEKLGGGPVDEARAAEFSKRATEIFTHLWRYKHDPITWGKKSHLVGIFFAASMRKHFVEFQLCEGDWKAEAYATLKYCDFTRNRRDNGSLLKSHPSVKREGDPVLPRTHKKAKKSHKSTRPVVKVKLEPSECIDLTADDDSHGGQKTSEPSGLVPTSFPRADSMDLSFPSSPLPQSPPSARNRPVPATMSTMSFPQQIIPSTSTSIPRDPDPAPPKHRKCINPLSGLVVPKRPILPEASTSRSHTAPSSAASVPTLPPSTDLQSPSSSTLSVEQATGSALPTPTASVATSAQSPTNATSAQSATDAMPPGIDLTIFPIASPLLPGSKKHTILKPSDKKTARNLYAQDYLSAYPRTTTTQFKEVWDNLVPISVKKTYKDLASAEKTS
ncbi:hypothetical protein BDN71DRAFT_1588572 [Pleurotus eryngii]|uniref:Uncharacterized protein n=1 Tax=Pleurotus eryngii TaxID=5323 RepID=A0A9P6A372_PLEER|nr:hypothetical protein BDN71DRAFT_1588572 [Pleurotus eryngii]